VNNDPTSPYYAARLIGYNASKAALNMLTVQLNAELQGTAIVVNSVSPGYVKADLTGHTGFMTPEEGARLPVQYALLGAYAVSGRFVEPGGETHRGEVTVGWWGWRAAQGAARRTWRHYLRSR
jgi:NAD(P)-dependent dehydrogenase (short-subunit alcohol dehydrogenase family)